MTKDSKISNDNEIQPNSLGSPSKSVNTKEIKQEIMKIIKNYPNLKSQKQITEILRQETGIIKSQSSISRLIEEMDPKPKRNDKGYWVLPDENLYNENLLKLEQFLVAGEKTPYFWGETAFAVLKTSPNYNSLVAKQVAETFPSEVLSTFCPNDTDVLVLYRLRKKKSLSAGENKEHVEENKGDVFEIDKTATSGSGKYRSSPMVKELRRICKEVREKKS